MDEWIVQASDPADGANAGLLVVDIDDIRVDPGEGPDVDTGGLCGLFVLISLSGRPDGVDGVGGKADELPDSGAEFAPSEEHSPSPELPGAEDGGAGGPVITIDEEDSEPADRPGEDRGPELPSGPGVVLLLPPPPGDSVLSP